MRLINQQLAPGTVAVLRLAPFAMLVVAYLVGSAVQLANHPGDKLLPGLCTMVDTINQMAFAPDKRTGDYLFWADTLASLARLAWGLGISTALALVLGMMIGMLSLFRALLAPFVGFVSMVPPLALLPILFITLGLGETAKIALIVIGVAPIMTRDLAQHVQALPREQIVKAQTLSAGTWLIALRVVLPQALPRLLTSLRLQLGPAFLFLIAAEAISSDSGLGFRIFLVRRYLAMDVIFPYVAWITLLSLLADFGLNWVRRRVFPWSQLEGL